MAKHHILIVDDDSNFNALLSDVYMQADYEVTTATNPEKALLLLLEKSFDLVVTDQRMPKMTGLEFVKRLRQVRAELPVVMVSGYLDNETIRELINAGVGGVFIKPLNVFSLLKKTAELIREVEQEEEEADFIITPEKRGNLAFPMRAFSGRADSTRVLAERMAQIQDFKGNLVLIGEKGSPFRALAEDLTGAEGIEGDHLLVLRPVLYEAAPLYQAICKGAEDVENLQRCTLLVEDMASLPLEAQQVLFSLARQQVPFDALPIPARTIFCVSEDLDTLYDRGILDEGLYIFLGTSELQIPPLREALEDVPALARSLLRQRYPHLDLEVDAISFLRKQEWPGNVTQLEEVLISAATMVEGTTIGEKIVSAAYKGEAAARPAEARVPGLEGDLRARRSGLLKAASLLAGEDSEKAAEILRMPTVAR